MLDLREVDFMASSGIALLINTRHPAARLGMPVAVVAANHRVRRPLTAGEAHGAGPVR